MNVDKKLSFSGHETFPFRYPWPAKCVRAVLKDPEAFLRPDAPVVLGVGKNMVRSMRFWGEALGLLQRMSNGREQVTELGKCLFGNDGWDPFLEVPATLWLLHWQLTKSPRFTATCHFAFTVLQRKSFRRDDLRDWLLEIAEGAGSRATKDSLKRDVDVFIRLYTPAKVRRDLPPEETFDAPLVELGLLSEEESKFCVFNVERKISLSDEVFWFSLVDFLSCIDNEGTSTAFETIAYTPGSPGCAFQLSERELVHRLSQIPEFLGIQYDETAGRRMVFGTANVTPLSILESFYSKPKKEVLF